VHDRLLAAAAALVDETKLVGGVPGSEPVVAKLQEELPACLLPFGLQRQRLGCAAADGVKLDPGGTDGLIGLREQCDPRALQGPDVARLGNDLRGFAGVGGKRVLKPPHDDPRRHHHRQPIRRALRVAGDDSVGRILCHAFRKIWGGSARR
jgi:hypothetical protein